jgi:hypothetical protein
MMRALLIVSLMLLATGCSKVQFAYNQLDWLIPYYVNKQVELNDDQDIYLEHSIDELLNWHCSSHLEAYAGLLIKVNTSFQSGRVTEKELQFFLDELIFYWKEIKQQASPKIAYLLLTSSDTQIDELFDNFKEKNREWLERFNEQTGEDLQEDYQKNITKQLERWFGPLQASQEQAVKEWSERFKPLGLAGLETRKHWQAELKRLLDQTDDPDMFHKGVEQLFVNPDLLYSADYAKTIEHNTDVTLELVTYIANGLDARQRKHLSRMIDSVSEDFVQLACSMDKKKEEKVSYEWLDI